MASPERNISAVDQRLVSLEEEATQLRAEVAALQEEIRWLTGQDEDEHGWLARGWVRASLLLTAVGMVALASLPYLLHRDASGPNADPPPGVSASARPASAAPRATVAPAPAPVKAAAREATPVPAPVRVRAPEVPEPARVLSAEGRAATAPRPRPVRERRGLQASDAVLVAPARGESP
jgi:type IV secretory pathway VirB10-like protein